MNIVIPLEYYLITSVIMFAAGIYGFISQRNRLTVIISLILMFNAVIINFAAFNKHLFYDKSEGIQASVLLMVVLLCEAAIAAAVFIRISKKEMQAGKNETGI